jgi:hypothetical protein
MRVWASGTGKKAPVVGGPGAEFDRKRVVPKLTTFAPRMLSPGGNTLNFSRGGSQGEPAEIASAWKKVPGDGVIGDHRARCRGAWGLRTHPALPNV